MKKFLFALLFLAFGLTANASEKPETRDVIVRNGITFNTPADYQVTKGDVRYVDFILAGIGDSIENLDVSKAASVEVWFVDSSNSKSDSLVLEVKAGNTVSYWAKTSALDLSATSKTTHVNLLIPGDGITAAYQVTGEQTFTNMRARRVNVGDITGALGYPYRTKGTVKIEY